MLPGIQYIQSTASLYQSQMQMVLTLHKVSGTKQCVKFSNCFSDYMYIFIHVGSPQGTKLDALLWPIYVNDLQAEDYHRTNMQTILLLFKGIVLIIYPQTL